MDSEPVVKNKGSYLTKSILTKSCQINARKNLIKT